MFSFNQHVQGFLNTPSLKGLIEGVSDFDFTNSPKSLSMDFPNVKRLGKRAEFLFEELLKSDKDIKLIDANIPLRNSERTIGEIDYLIERNKEVIHLELATKFYLLDESLDTELINQWIGPNRKDFLYLKVSKLRDHQFPIIKSDEFKAYINLNNHPLPTHQSLMLKAQLFVPIDRQVELPENYNNCVMGNWITIEQFEELKQDLFFIPNKHDWFINPNENNKWYSKLECINQIQDFHSRQFSPMIWMKDKDKISTRAFVVWW